MALLDVRNISKTYGDNIILEGVSLQVNPGEKIGLVGANGCGKTTLLKIIMGAEEADQGETFTSKGVSLGYLSQKPGFLPGAELEEVLRDALAGLYSIKEEMALLERKMASYGADKNNTALITLMERYGELAHQFEEKEGYMLENRLQMIARGLGFRKADLGRRVETFSGGEKTRAQLATLLLSEPDLLLLDEPTNSLDAESIEWLENFLGGWRGALLVVSHDRFFLDRVVEQIASLENKKLLSYHGNFSSFLHQREIVNKTLDRAYKKQEATVKKQQDFIRNAAAETKRQARSREKFLERLGIVKKPEEAPSWKARFGFAGRENRGTVVFEGVSKYFGSYPVFKNASFEIKGGDRVAVLGPNGAGKTTLLRVITGEEVVESGVITIGSGSRMAYFDQEQKNLKGKLTVLENIMETSGMSEAEARRFLGGYLFRGDRVFKLVESLSGGERSRLALAMMALEESNFLIMDEPTNHLDIWGIGELEAALSTYPGTLLIVSHDRYFVSRTATKILEIKNKHVRLYNRTYLEYREIQLKEKEGEKVKESADSHPHQVTARELRQRMREKEKAKREEILALRRQRRRLHNSILEVEEEITAKEGKIGLLEEQLAGPGIYDDFAKARPLLDELSQTRDEVGVLYEKWEELSLLLVELPQEE